MNDVVARQRTRLLYAPKQALDANFHLIEGLLWTQIFLSVLIDHRPDLFLPAEQICLLFVLTNVDSLALWQYSTI